MTSATLYWLLIILLTTPTFLPNTVHAKPVEGAGAVADGAADAAKGAGEAVSDAAGTVKDGAVDAGKSVGGWFGSAFESVKEGVSSAGSAVADTAKKPCIKLVTSCNGHVKESRSKFILKSAIDFANWIAFQLRAERDRNLHVGLCPT
ncbi:hypothetical protein Y032_0658g1256 [Ancylostoma ceylanicum]|uniref:Uncharacterized protein n=1 Tax=Ancylostoma ceylanicum TaxID=53326 RepID=A0A016WJD5_9BILA|nr:hypothetical protein Y032_0658g1256 [Ancylostoma ceylanicum]